jgi:hypothetical protein
MTENNEKYGEDINDGQDNINNESEQEVKKAQEKVEKEELEKKYYSKKKEIRSKINEAEKALNTTIKEAEEDFEKVVQEEPELLTEDDKKDYQKYLSDQKEKIKKDIEVLQAHEIEMELDYEDLKTEPKGEMLVEYFKTVNHGMKINEALMKMIFDYFNFLNDNEEAQNKSKIHIDCFLAENGIFSESFPHNTNMDYFVGHVMVDFKGVVRVIVTVKKFFSQGDGFVYKLGFVSEGKTNLNPDYLMKKILYNAIAHSKIKGQYITLAPGSINWSIEKLEKRGFEDIYLPKSIMEDLRLYTTLYKKTGKLLRYLMIGNPGTGKTESTLAIANFLKNMKVTVIKTMVCDALKEKIELAELLAPSIVIFDDIDLSLGSRKKGLVSAGLSQFLDVLDGTEKVRKDVGFIATTNSLDLLDMAAQRPGRFDKLLAFDSLTKANIRSIILKSLKYNFELDESSLEVAPFVSQSVIDKFHTTRVTGSHVYNTTKMLYLRIQTLELENIDADWIINEIKTELDTLKKIRTTDYLNDKFNNSSGEIGFAMKNDVAEDEEEVYETEAEVTEEKGTGMSLNFELKEESSENVKKESGESEGYSERSI